MSDFYAYQNEAVKMAIYPESSRGVYPALGLANEAGEVLGQIKKCIRDDGGNISPERRDAIKKGLGDTLWYMSILASDCQLSLANIAEANLSKLKDRQSRGVLGGSGDNR